MLDTSGRFVTAIARRDSGIAVRRILASSMLRGWVSFWRGYGIDRDMRTYASGSSFLTSAGASLISGAGVMAGMGARAIAPFTPPASTTTIIPIEANERIVGFEIESECDVTIKQKKTDKRQ